ncbi:hypothetical protein AB0B25_03265 [Nocardia sp. NPDC049190]|uniref:hypothetical protein n=1 Tax=Nocardia sp. NPDC049190 TaxID=3155650 RepID=UPI0033CEE494
MHTEAVLTGMAARSNQIADAIMQASNSMHRACTVLFLRSKVPQRLTTNRDPRTPDAVESAPLSDYPGTLSARA